MRTAADLRGGLVADRRGKPGFTLLELMVSMVILVIIATTVFSMANTIGKIWSSTNAKIESFQGARIAFEALTRQVSQATLNTYYAYYRSDNSLWAPTDNTAPARYGRYSELHFISGASTIIPDTVPAWSGETPPVRAGHAIFFQSPLGYSGPPAAGATGTDLRGLDKLLNASGFYVEFNSDKPARPLFLRTSPPRYRYRLMQVSQPSASLEVYNPDYAQSKGFDAYTKWYTDAINAGATRPLADNIIALILMPERSPADASVSGTAGDPSQGNPIAADYLYDSRTADPARAIQLHQLPPMLRVTMVAIDEPSAQLLAARSAQTAPVLIPTGSFQVAASYSADLQQLTDSLTAARIRYRVFAADVGIAGSKWSEQ